MIEGRKDEPRYFAVGSTSEHPGLPFPDGSSFEVRGEARGRSAIRVVSPYCGTVALRAVPRSFPSAANDVTNTLTPAIAPGASGASPASLCVRAIGWSGRRREASGPWGLTMWNEVAIADAATGVVAYGGSNAWDIGLGSQRGGQHSRVLGLAPALQSAR